MNKLLGTAFLLCLVTSGAYGADPVVSDGLGGTVPWFAVNPDGSLRYTGKTLSVGTVEQSVHLSSEGFSGSGGKEVVFSSNVVILGDLIVRSANAKAIHLPAGGLHISSANQAMESKKIRTSTITMVGSALLWEAEGSPGVFKATMTATEIDMGAGAVKGRIRNSFQGPGAPLASDCDEAAEAGAMYMQTTPGRLHVCDGASWRYTTLSP